MTTSKYRTHQGRMLDIGALVLKNERVRAVGNMGVNARGDRIDADDRPIDSRNQQINRRYRRQTTNVTDETPLTEKPPTVAATPATAAATATPPQVVKRPPAPSADTKEAGLAGALARARAEKKGGQ